jgi:hypothetical protein
MAGVSLTAISPRGEFDRYLDLSHLQVFVARPTYLLAMKCAAMRLGAEFHDLDGGVDLTGNACRSGRRAQRLARGFTTRRNSN